MRLTIIAAATFAAGIAAAPLAAQANCKPGAAWAYTGTAKGTPTVTVTDKGTQLGFAAKGKSDPATVIFSSVNEADKGTYQVNGDLDVDHLSEDATITLEGAESAAVGRPFDVTMAAGDGGSSSFSRPINTTGQPFTVHIRMNAAGKASFTIRNYLVCKLR